MTAFFSVEDLTIRFGGLVAVSQVTFRLDRGGCFGLIGPNGAGKTSLINAISGLVPITSGRIALEGRELQRMPPYAAAQGGIGRAFQHSELLWEETVLANVVTGLSLRSRFSLLHHVLGTPRLRNSQRIDRQRAEAIMARFGLSSLAEVRAGDLPHGLAKKVDVARALVGRPKLLLLDEPTSGLGEREADDLMSACLDCARESETTILLIEHNLRIVMSLAERIVVLDHGQKIAEGTPGRISSDPAVVEAYLGQEATDA